VLLKLTRLFAMMMINNAHTQRGSSMVKEKLLNYEKQNIQINYKFGVLFSRENQNTEDQMYNNGVLLFVASMALNPLVI